MEADTEKHMRHRSSREGGSSRRDRGHEDSGRRREDNHGYRSRRHGDEDRPRRDRHEQDERSRSPDRRQDELRRRERDKDRTRDRDREWERDRGKDRDRRGDRDRDRGRGRDKSRSPAPVKKRGPLPDQADSFALVQQGGDGDDAEVKPPKETANYSTTGVLAAASNAVAQADGSTITLKYHEPPEARKPAARDAWRLFVFKDGDIIDTVPLSTRSCWLIGREPAVVDLLAAHPSISKQHAVVQFRYIERRNEFGDRLGRVRPYLLDLASANGTVLNGDPVVAQRYIELREKDMLQFGQSTREYVLMRGNG